MKHVKDGTGRITRFKPRVTLNMQASPKSRAERDTLQVALLLPPQHPLHCQPRGLKAGRGQSKTKELSGLCGCYQRGKYTELLRDLQLLTGLRL